MTPLLAYWKGRDARNLQRERVSPFYNETKVLRGVKVDVTEKLNQYFFSGFDLVPWEETKEKIGNL